MSLDRAAFGRHLPNLYFWLRSLRYAVVPERPDPTTARLIDDLCGAQPRVLWGPFAGMLYGLFASGSGLLPKIAGTYELELHGAIAESLAREPQRVINIGAGEGYYAVGYARALAACKVHAFDPDRLARQRLRQLVRLNGVETRVAIAARATQTDLARLVDGARALVVCDCEGCELELLEPRDVPRLSQADLLVECHDFIAAGTTELLAKRFSATHEVMVIPAAPRATLPPHLSRLGTEDRVRVTHEGRPPGMRWLWMRART